MNYNSFVKLFISAFLLSSGTVSAFNHNKVIKNYSKAVERIQQSQKELTGIVIDEASMPMIGVQIQIKGTAIGVITGIDGDFTLKCKPGDILILSYVGYKTIEHPYKGEKILSIKMSPETENLDEVVVIGYGKQKKKLSSKFCNLYRKERIVSNKQP